jgi:O-methyltransferase
VGDYLEFGVYRGASLNIMHRASRDSGLSDLRIFGFDSFEGLPEEASTTDAGVWTAGAFKSELGATEARLTDQGVDWTRTTLVPGWFDQTLTEDRRAALEIDRASVVMIDCDLYTAAKLALEFVAPLLANEAIVFFDDWSIGGLDEKNLGESLAFEEFTTEQHPEFAVSDFPAYSNQSRAFLLSRSIT